MGLESSLLQYTKWDGLQAGTMVEPAPSLHRSGCLQNSPFGGASTLGKTITIFLRTIEIGVSGDLRRLNATSRLQYRKLF